VAELPAAGPDTQGGGVNPSPAPAGAGTPPVANGGGTQAPAPETPAPKFTDADMAAMRRSIEKEIADKANKDKLEADGKVKELLDLEKQGHEATAAELRKLRVELAVRDLAGEVGLRTDRAKQALALVREQVEYDKDGSPTNLEKLLKGVLKDMPEWAANAAEPVKAPASAGGATCRPSTGRRSTPKA
jgi:hypothetical protein